jgi:hypothetical protein
MNNQLGVEMSIYREGEEHTTQEKKKTKYRTKGKYPIEEIWK